MIDFIFELLDLQRIKSVEQTNHTGFWTICILDITTAPLWWLLVLAVCHFIQILCIQKL